MGYPINSYSLFKAIQDNDSGLIKNFFGADYSLFGFIIHDPVKSEKFSSMLDSGFQKFNIISGNDFLFTAIADPPESWLNWAESKRAFRDLYFYEKEKINDPELIIKTTNPSYTTSFIANVLGINHHYLPVIIFTPDLRSDVFYFMETSESNFQQQITDLNYISKALKNGDNIEHLIEDVLPSKPKKVSLDSGTLVDKLLYISKELVNSASNSAPLQESRVLDGNWEKNDSDIFFDSAPEKDVENALLSPSAKDKNFIVKEDDHYVIELLCENTFAQPETVINISYDRIAELVEDNQSQLEPQTLIYLREGIELLSIYRSNRDASPYIIQFAKALEFELSYSVVHWVRERYDIMLPEYFYEYEPGKEAKIPTRKKLLDFNYEKNGQWSVPMIGEQLLGLELTSELKRDSPFKTHPRFKKFVQQIQSMKNIRNKACHIKPTNEDHLDTIIDGWIELLSGSYINDLHILKEQYRGEAW